MVTTAAEMRAKRARGVEFFLPEYGDVVMIRPMDPSFFFKTGRVPDFLTAHVQKMIDNSPYEPKHPDTSTPEKTAEWLKWLDELVKWTIVSPKVVDNPQADDELGIDEIGYADKLTLYRWFGVPAQTFRALRDQQTKPVGPVDAQEDDGDRAEPGAESAKDRLALVGAA